MNLSPRRGSYFRFIGFDLSYRKQQLKSSLVVCLLSCFGGGISLGSVGLSEMTQKCLRDESWYEMVASKLVLLSPIAEKTETRFTK